MVEFWEKVKKDLQKGIREGMASLKEGADTVMTKAGEFTDEGRRRYKVFELKSRVQKELAELGGKVYSVNKAGREPLSDPGVKAVLARVQRLEAQIGKLEGKPAPKAPAKTAKPSAPAKRGPKKTAPAATGKPAPRKTAKTRIKVK